MTVAPYFASNGSSYIAISPLRDGAAGLFRHLVHVHISQKRILPLTHGTFEVRQIVYWDELNNFVYAISHSQNKISWQPECKFCFVHQILPWHSRTSSWLSTSLSCFVTTTKIRCSLKYPSVPNLSG